MLIVTNPIIVALPVHIQVQPQIGQRQLRLQISSVG